VIFDPVVAVTLTALRHWLRLSTRERLLRQRRTREEPVTV
jgi:hypothetical protein